MLEIFIILLVAAADQVTKYIAVQYLKPLKTVPILEGLFSLTYVENRGGSFWNPSESEMVSYCYSSAHHHRSSNLLIPSSE